ncbi:NAD(P)H-dependent oxidoreductase [bacterium]|nr:NAD(P)H-dependent oxidoreductase [bacterium]
MRNVLVAYFSASGITERIAKTIAELANADIYEIKPVESYSAADLNWLDKTSRSTREMQDLSFRPEIIDTNAHIDDYDIVFLGFPIWWYVAPTIINTFLEKYDFSHKKIVLFATSGGSGFGKTIDNIRPSVSDTTKIIEGKVLNRKTDTSEIQAWVKTIV